MAVTAVVAAVICLCEGLFFIFVRAPHPYGWEGFDHYRDYALVLARGDAFPTLDRIWGYPYFLAGFYRLFGDRPWIPLVAQAALNALVPILLYNEVKQRLGSRVAAVTAVLAGACSFNTIYASTQSSDAVCTVLFVAALVAFGRAQRSPAAWRFAASGALAALALEFRPNLLLFPLCLVAVDLVTTGRRRAMRHVAAFLLVAVAIWLPWPIRNYRLTGRFIPATTHGAVQLWYGSLEVGSFFENWVDNPRAAFEASPFDYSSPDAGPLVVTAAALPAAARLPQQVTLTYWTDRDPRHVELSAAGTSGPQTTFMVPGQPPDTIVSYYVEAVWPSAGGVLTTRTPVPGAGDPLRHVVTANHLGDLDFHNEDLDVFDLVRLLRHLAWREPVPNQAALDLDGDGVLTRADLDRAAGILASPAGFAGRPTPAVVADVRTTQDAVTLELTDDSSLTVPRVFGGRITDLDVDGRMAADIMRSRRSFASLAALRSTSADPGTADPHLQLATAVNAVFYRAEPHREDRYTALAIDNIRRAPAAFVAASLRRVVRLFVVVGSDDANRAHQFRFARYIYGAATVVSLAYFVLFAAGVVLTLVRREDVALLLAAVVYVPATIFPLLTNMRYTVTNQPVVFVFVAVALLALTDTVRRRGIRA